MALKKFALPILLLLLAGCEGPRQLIFNMTEYPIKITYSLEMFQNWPVCLMPGGSAGVIGPPFGYEIKDLTVSDSAGQTHVYSTIDLAALRGSNSSDMWAYYPNGLRFVPDNERSRFESLFDKVGSRGCSSD